jgi:transcriptional regulator with XRE-family HTH domain
LENYLNKNSSVLPTVDKAVKIAQVLGVSVEYLVTGKDSKAGKTQPPLPPDLRLLVDTADKLSPKNRRLAIKLVKTLREQEDEGKK